MWIYNSTYLSHAFHKKGYEWDDHKYIDKIKTKNGKYRYIYEEPKQLPTQSKKVVYGKNSGVLAKRFPTLKEIAGIYTIDLNAGKKIDKIYRSIERNNDIADLDKFDDVYSSSDLAESAKRYFKELYSFYDIQDKDKAWQDDIKAMKQSLIDYFGSTPWKFNKFSDDEIVCIYMMILMIHNGYDSETNLSHYIQNLGWVDESQVLKNSGIKDISDLKKITGRSTKKEDMEAINHDNLNEMALSTDGNWEKNYNYPPSADIGYTSNCAYCTLAYEIRRRGYDVEASSVNWATANNREEIGNWYINKKSGEKCTLQLAAVPTIDSNWDKNLKNKLLSDVDASSNARGQFCVTWKGVTTGHSIVYEITNGDIIFRDCQINKEYSWNEFVKVYGPRTSHMYFLRTDDKDISLDALKGVRNRGSYWK